MRRSCTFATHGASASATLDARVRRCTGRGGEPRRSPGGARVEPAAVDPCTPSHPPSCLATAVRLGLEFRTTNLTDVAAFLAEHARLACAHASVVVHRDVEPRTVLLRRDGRALLADVGFVLDLHGPPQDMVKWWAVARTLPTTAMQWPGVR